MLDRRESAGAKTARPQFISSTSVVGWFRILQFWVDRSRQRRRLAELAAIDNYLLKDIGISQAEALREAAKPFWR
jgi:uncharacterized protein YjiS (DUF1127 family)